MNRMQQPYSQEVNFQSQALAKTFLANVFSWMFLALAVTALVSYTVAGNESFMQLMFNMNGGMSLLGWIIMLSP